MSRETLLAATLVELADTLADDFDPLDLLQRLSARSIELLGADAAALMLTDQRGDLRLVASATTTTTSSDAFALLLRGGPCLEAYRTGNPVVNLGTVEARRRWPATAAGIEDAGWSSLHALPLRLRAEVIGVLALAWRSERTLDEADLAVATALTGIATIGLLHERTPRQKEVLARQLQSTLNGRVTVEQAKGVVAELLGVEVADAAGLLEAWATRHRVPLTRVAAGVLDGSLSVSRLGEARRDGGDVPRA